MTDAAASDRSTAVGGGGTSVPSGTDTDAVDMDAVDATIVVVVARTGGFAGIRREWRAAPPVDDQPRWIALIDSCPWDAEVRAGDGADRFTWHIHAQCGPREHSAELPEQAVKGPWRELVDVVRNDAPQPDATPSPTPAPRPTPSPRPAPSPGPASHGSAHAPR